MKASASLSHYRQYQPEIGNCRQKKAITHSTNDAQAGRIHLIGDCLRTSAMNALRLQRHLHKWTIRLKISLSSIPQQSATLCSKSVVPAELTVEVGGEPELCVGDGARDMVWLVPLVVPLVDAELLFGPANLVQYPREP
jgi:hypothetical protein